MNKNKVIVKKTIYDYLNKRSWEAKINSHFLVNKKCDIAELVYFDTSKKSKTESINDKMENILNALYNNEKVFGKYLTYEIVKYDIYNGVIIALIKDGDDLINMSSTYNSEKDKNIIIFYKSKDAYMQWLYMKKQIDNRKEIDMILNSHKKDV